MCALKLFVREILKRVAVTITPTSITAAIAGTFAGIVMPILWSRFSQEGTSLVVAFLLVVALPAHAFVVGFDRSQSPDPRALDTALLKRVGTWLGTALLTMFIAQAIRA